MVKNNIYERILIVLLTILICALPIYAIAQSPQQKVYDNASLFTNNEESSINSMINNFIELYNNDLVVVSSNDVPNNGTIAFADDFYDYNNFGYDDKQSGLLILIDMTNRVFYISTKGEAISYINDSRLDDLIDTGTSKLKNGDYYGCIEDVVSMLNNYYKSGILEGQYNYDSVTGERLTSAYKVLQTNEIIIALVAGIIVALSFYFIVKSRYQLKYNTYKYPLEKNVEVQYTQKSDAFLRQHVVRTRRVQNNNNNKGGFGGGLGSGTHFSGSGSSHGGGGGSF